MRILLLCLCLVAVVFADDYTLNTAKRLYKEKRYEESRLVYAYISLQREAIRPYLQYAVADCFFQQKHYAEALAELNKIQVQERPVLQDEVQALQYACYDFLGRNDELTESQRVWYGEYLFSRNRFAESIKYLTNIPQTESSSSKVKYILGRNYYSLGEWSSANMFLQAVDTPEALYYRALNLLRLGNAVKARELLQTVAQGDSPHAPYALFQLGRLAQFRGELGQRNRYYRQLTQRFPEHILADDVAWIVGWYLYTEQQYPQAKDVFLYGYTQHPQGDHSDALLFWAGKSALRLNKKAEAELIWKKVALQFPGRYYGVRSLDLVSINIPITDTLQETGEIPASVRQFMLEQGYSEALVELEQSSGNIRVADIFAARRAIAAKAAENGNNALAIRALYPLFQYAEKRVIV